MDEIRNFTLDDIKEVKNLADQLIGQGYYTSKELEDIYRRSIANNTNCSFVLLVDGKIKGFRFTYPPGNWKGGKGKGLNEKLWSYTKEETAYFQSLFIDPQQTNRGLGKKMSEKSLEALKSLGTKGVVCHSWVESPNDSSRRYLQALGFKSVALHKEYWKEVDYTCPLGENPCLCTADEMYLDLASK